MIWTEKDLSRSGISEKKCRVWSCEKNLALSSWTHAQTKHVPGKGHETAYNAFNRHLQHSCISNHSFIISGNYQFSFVEQCLKMLTNFKQKRSSGTSTYLRPKIQFRILRNQIFCRTFSLFQFYNYMSWSFFFDWFILMKL